MSYNFLTPRIDRIDTNGRVQSVHPGSSLSRLLRRPVLLLPRDLCSYSLFSIANLPMTRRRQAAVLHAHSASPYQRPGSIMVKSGTDYGIWWWDANRLDALLETSGLSSMRHAPCPESLCQPSPVTAHEQWRVVRLTHGYEAQVWRDKTLQASAWRPDRYVQASWQSFVKKQRGFGAAPAVPPVPSDLPVNFNSKLPLSRPEMSRQQMAVWAGASVVALCLGVSAYLTGQTWQLKAEVEKVQAETDQIRASTPQSLQVAELNQAQQKLVAYQALEARTSPLSSAGAAIGILAYHDIVPRKVSSDTESLQIVVDYNLLSKLKPVIADLETAGYFEDIRPRSEVSSQTITIEMKLKASAPPLGVLES